MVWNKGPVKLIQRVKQLIPRGSFIFTVCVKSVPLYYFKDANVVLQMTAKEFLKPISKNGEIGCFNLESHF